MEENSKKLEELAGVLLELMQVEGKVSLTKEDIDSNEEIEEDGDGKIYKVDIESSESGLLIGRHGETLNSFQLILSLMMHKVTGSWVKLYVDIGGYRKAREETIKEMVGRIKSEVLETGREVVLPYLSSVERRFVHVFLSSDDAVKTESSGEGMDRRLTIKLKTQ